jgi:ABC-2 type transport system ATP-binding protein
MATAVVETSNLTRKYDETIAVKNLNLTVNQGEIFGFLGHNGAGKTTTISMLTSLLLPTSGSAKVCGLDVVKDNLAVRQRIGYVPENIRLYNELTVAENLNFFAALSGIQDIEKKVQETLVLLDCADWLKRRVGNFSKGMRQRIGIAQALLHQPEVLFLDEPSSGLDPEATRDVGNLILRLNRDYGITIFMNTHQLAEVTKLCSHIGIMRQGQLVLSDSLATVMARFPNEHSLEDIYLNLEAGMLAGEVTNA